MLTEGKFGAPLGRGGLCDSLLGSAGIPAFDECSGVHVEHRVEASNIPLRTKEATTVDIEKGDVLPEQLGQLA